MYKLSRRCFLKFLIIVRKQKFASTLTQFDKFFTHNYPRNLILDIFKLYPDEPRFLRVEETCYSNSLDQSLTTYSFWFPSFHAYHDRRPVSAERAITWTDNSTSKVSPRFHDPFTRSVSRNNRMLFTILFLFFIHPVQDNFSMLQYT